MADGLVDIDHGLCKIGSQDNLAANHDPRSQLALQEPDMLPSQDAVTVEAEESRLVCAYEAALAHLTAGNEFQAQKHFTAMLEDPFLERVLQTENLSSPQHNTATVRQVKFLALKHLASILERASSPALKRRALVLYCEASALDDSDVVMWRRLAALALASGQLALTRCVCEQALRISPRHPALMETLHAALVLAGDHPAAQMVALQIVSEDCNHPLANAYLLHPCTPPREPDCRQFQVGDFGNKGDLSHDSTSSQKVHEVRLLAPTWCSLAEAVAKALALPMPDSEIGRPDTPHEAPLRFVIPEQADPSSPFLCGSTPQAEPGLAQACLGYPLASLHVLPTSPQDKKSPSKAATPAQFGRGASLPDYWDDKETVEQEAVHDNEAVPQSPGVASDGEKARAPLQVSEHASDGECRLSEPVLGDRIENQQQKDGLIRASAEQVGDNHKESAASKAATALGPVRRSRRQQLKEEEAAAAAALAEATASQDTNVVSATPNATLDDLAELLASWNSEYRSGFGSTPRMPTPVKSQDSVTNQTGQEDGEGDASRSTHESREVASFLANLAPHESAYWVGVRLIQHLGIQAALLPWVSCNKDQDAGHPGLRSVFGKDVFSVGEETAGSESALAGLGKVLCMLEANLRQEYGSIDASVDMHGALLLGELFLQEAINDENLLLGHAERCQHWLSLYAARRLNRAHALDEDPDHASQLQARWHWANARLSQLLGHRTEAIAHFALTRSACYLAEDRAKEDLMEVDQLTTANEDPGCEVAATHAECAREPFAGTERYLELVHLNKDAVVSPAAVASQMAKMKLQLALANAPTMLQNRQHQELLDILMPVALPACSTQKSMQTSSPFSGSQCTDALRVVLACSASLGGVGNLVTQLRCTVLLLAQAMVQAGLAPPNGGARTSDQSNQSVVMPMLSKSLAESLLQLLQSAFECVEEGGKLGIWSTDQTRIHSGIISQASREPEHHGAPLDSLQSVLWSEAIFSLQARALELFEACFTVTANCKGSNEAPFARMGSSGKLTLSKRRWEGEVLVWAASVLSICLDNARGPVEHTHMASVLAQSRILHNLLAQRSVCCGPMVAKSKGDVEQHQPRAKGVFLKMCIQRLNACRSRAEAAMEARVEVLRAKNINNSLSGSHPKSSFERDGVQDVEQPDVERDMEALPDELMLNLEEDPEVSQCMRDMAAADKALAQSIYCLYGLTLGVDGLDQHNVDTKAKLTTKEACAEVWALFHQYVLKRLRHGRITKHEEQAIQDMLDTIHSCFNGLPTHVLVGSPVIQAILAPGPDQPRDEYTHSLGIVTNALSKASAEEFKTNVLSSIPSSHVEVLRHLYKLFLRFFPEDTSCVANSLDEITDRLQIAESLCRGKEVEESSLTRYLQRLLWDVILTPNQDSSWWDLGLAFDELLDTSLNDACRLVDSASWQASSDRHSDSICAYRRRMVRCFIASRECCKSEASRAAVDKHLAIVLYDSLQDVPPEYDQRTVHPKRDTRFECTAMQVRMHCQAALDARPHDWQLLFYQGKVAHKLGYPAPEYLGLFARAAVKARGMLEPFYRLHASRLKALLQPGGASAATLRTVAAHPFLQDTKQACAEVNWDQEARGSESSLEAWVDKLYEDGMAALSFCLTGNDNRKYYHKARYRMAVMRLWMEGRKQCSAQTATINGVYRWKAVVRTCLQELSFLFQVGEGRKPFQLNMWENVRLKNTPSASKTSRRRRQLLSSSGSFSKWSLEVGNVGGASEQLAWWQHKDAKLEGIGHTESSRKYMAAVRKALALYVGMLEVEGGVQSLQTLAYALGVMRDDPRHGLHQRRDLHRHLLAALVRGSLKLMSEETLWMHANKQIKGGSNQYAHSAIGDQDISREQQVWELVVRAAWQSDVLVHGQDSGTERMSFSLLGAYCISARVASLSVAGRRAVDVVAHRQASLRDALGLLFQVYLDYAVVRHNSSMNQSGACGWHLVQAAVKQHESAQEAEWLKSCGLADAQLAVLGGLNTWSKEMVTENSFREFSNLYLQWLTHTCAVERLEDLIKPLKKKFSRGVKYAPASVRALLNTIWISTITACKSFMSDLKHETIAGGELRLPPGAPSMATVLRVLVTVYEDHALFFPDISQDSGAAGTSTVVEVGELILLAHAQCPDKSIRTRLPHNLRNNQTQTAIQSAQNQDSFEPMFPAEKSNFSSIEQKEGPSAFLDVEHHLTESDDVETCDVQLEQFVSEMDVQDPFGLVYDEGFGVAGGRRQSNLSEIDFSDLLEMPESKRMKREQTHSGSDADSNHDG